MSPILTVDELLAIAGRNEVVLVDAGNGAAARASYEKEHLQGAVFVDMDTELSGPKNDISVGGRHPLPDTDRFAATLSRLGLSQNSHIVIYDDKNGANAAARFWWMLKAAGHEKVQVLNGGLQEARRKGYPMQSGKNNPGAGSYTIQEWRLPLAHIGEVEAAAGNPNRLVIDVRSKERYDGITEPLDPVAGHIPGAINIPFTENLDEDGLFLSPLELKKKYTAATRGIDSSEIIVHCGSGVTACHTLLAMVHAGMDIPKLYVGSWSEWCRSGRPIGTNTD